MPEWYLVGIIKTVFSQNLLEFRAVIPLNATIRAARGFLISLHNNLSLTAFLRAIKRRFWSLDDVAALTANRIINESSLSPLITGRF